MGETWKAAGMYMETCNCDSACPCIFLSPPSEGECRALVAWHVEEGNFGEVDIGGLNVALYVYSPGNMVEGKWKVALYLDDKATELQREGLGLIFSGQAGGHPGQLAPLIEEVLGLQVVPIEFSANGKQRTLRIGNAADAEIEAVEGQKGAEVTISNAPLCIAPGHPSVAARSKRASFNDYGHTLEVSDKNGFFSPFTYQGP